MNKKKNKKFVEDDEYAPAGKKSTVVTPQIFLDPNKALSTPFFTFVQNDFNNS